MPHLYWDTPLLSPFLAMDHRQLKRSRSSDSIDRTWKKAKSQQQQQQQLQVGSPISLASEPLLHSTTFIYPSSISPVPTHVQHYFEQAPSVKSISISTKSLHSQQPLPPPSTTRGRLSTYENMNGLLHDLHVERFGDPENRESWWEQEDVEMQDNTEYNQANTVLRQAFLARHQRH